MKRSQPEIIDGELTWRLGGLNKNFDIPVFDRHNDFVF